MVATKVGRASIAMLAAILTSCSPTGKQELARDWFFEDDGGLYGGRLRLGDDNRYELKLMINHTVVDNQFGSWHVIDNQLVLTRKDSIETRFAMVGAEPTVLLREVVPKSANLPVICWPFPKLELSPTVLSDSEVNLTSNESGGFALCQPYMTPKTPNYGKHYLVQRMGKNWGKVGYLGVRYDQERQDKVTATNAVVSALTYNAAGARYFHHLFQHRDGVAWQASHYAIGSSDVIAMEGAIIGTVWNSPDFSEPEGNKLYVLGPPGPHWIGLEGDADWRYEVRKVSGSTFELHCQKPDGSKAVTRHRFPVPYSVTSLR